MGYLKIDKGTPGEVFLCYFRQPCIETNILTNFFGPSIIFTEIKGFFISPYISYKILGFGPKMAHSAAGENRRGLKIVMQTWFMCIYMYVTTKIPYNI